MMIYTRWYATIPSLHDDGTQILILFTDFTCRGTYVRTCTSYMDEWIWTTDKRI